MGLPSSSAILFIFLSFLSLVTSIDYDFSFMKIVENATDTPIYAEYDYIVVGGGTAGCPLAATLSEKYSVLVLERGDSPLAHPNVLIAGGVLLNMMEEDNGRTPAERFTSEDGVDNLRGRVLGGSSMINAGIFSRANPGFFDPFPGSTTWDMAAVDEAYNYVEDIVLTLPTAIATWQTAVRTALTEAGIVPDNGVTAEHLNGTKITGSLFDEAGRRHGSPELLNKGNFENLKVAIHATVERVIFAGVFNPRAIGVLYADSNGRRHRAVVRTGGEVILSAGALGSPQLLLLSGVGSAADLSAQHIPVVRAHGNVGKFMADNPRNNLHVVIPFPEPGSTAQTVGITGDYYIETLSYSIKVSPEPFPFSFYAPPHTADMGIGTIVVKPPGPLSHGELSLASWTDVRVSPRVRFNYFSDPLDLARCVMAMRKVGELLETTAMEGYKYTDLAGERGFTFLGESLPANYKSNTTAMEDFCRDSKATFWHYHGGCLTGKVVDGDYKVYGIGSLRVIDGSTLTLSPGTNPQATIMMLGRYMGVQILKERDESK